MLTSEANPALYRAQTTIPVVVSANPADCHFQFNPVGTAVFSSSCDIAKQVLAGLSVPYKQEDAPAGAVAAVKVGSATVQSFDATAAGAGAAAARAAFVKDTSAALTAAGYPPAANPSVVKMAHPFDVFRPQTASIVGILFILMVYVTMVYGPVAAALVELFPTRIRYTAMSLPYHIGNGWFGGLLPATTFAMIAATGDIYYGLWYPIVFAGITVVVGTLLLPETKDRDIFSEDHTVHRV